MAGTYNPNYSGVWGTRIAWTREAEVEVSQDHAIVLQSGSKIKYKLCGFKAEFCYFHAINQTKRTESKNFIILVSFLLSNFTLWIATFHILVHSKPWA